MLDIVDVGYPFADIIPGARGKLLVTLVQLERPVTVRALARHSGVSPQAALNLVDELSEAGVVHAERVGGLILVDLNRDHILAEPLDALARARGRLIRRLSDELGAWRQLAAAWLFGSAARGDGDRSSDIDLFLVTETSTEDAEWSANVATLANLVYEWTGNHAQIVEHSWESFAQLARDDNLLIPSLRKDGIALTPESQRRLREVA
jgi:predicted nucleotidyltransferase